jgi:hypothetical protein
VCEVAESAVSVALVWWFLCARLVTHDFFLFFDLFFFLTGETRSGEFFDFLYNAFLRSVSRALLGDS